jgi:hypothetical protein
VQIFEEVIIRENIVIFNMDGIAQQTNTSDGPKGIALLEQTVKDLRKTAKKTKAPTMETLEVNGKTCNITASKEGEKFEITAECTHTPLGSRICRQVAKFTYDKSNVGNNLRAMVGRINEIDHTNNHTKADKIIAFITALDQHATKAIDIADLLTFIPEINKTLDDIQIFVCRNDLSPDEMSQLRTAVIDFGGNKKLIRFPNKTSSINENDCDSNCLDLSLKLEAIEILLDAKEKGYVGLERNGPPEILGHGRYNTVQLAYTKKNKEGPIVLKPCDLSKQNLDFGTFIHATQSIQLFVGSACGSYRRNKATSMVQDMLCDIGKKNGITVPHVIASVFAAEMQEDPYIAMERLNGRTIWQASRLKKIPYNNTFIGRETWIQLLDILTGQIDRHANNVMLIEDDVVKEEDGQVVAFDHDLSFVTHPPRSFASIIPKVISIPSRIIEDGHLIKTAIDGQKASNYCMPPVIDMEMYTVIENLDLNELENMYRGRGLIESQIEAAIARARELQTKVQQLKDQGLIIEPNEWVSSPLVQAHCNAHNFYAKWHLSAPS